MIVVHGSSLCLARAIRRAGDFVSLRSGKKRFTTLLSRWDNPQLPTVDWNRDVLLAYPNSCRNSPAAYGKLMEFYRSNKYDQWQILREYFKTPEINDPPYVVRPLRHEGGEDFQVVNTLPPESRKATHYWRSLWKRSCEYRVFFVYGQKVLTLLKRVPPDTSQEIPWNAGVSSFVTVHDHDNDRLRHTRFYEKAVKFFEDYPFHLCAVDVLYRNCKHRVVEVNFSPGVLIPENKTVLASALLRRPNHDTSNPANAAATPPPLSN